MQKCLSWCQEHRSALGKAATGLAAFALIRRWLLIFWIWPDSSIYLTAAMNFVRHGTLFIYTNYPSGSFLPQTEVYADYPPGFPLFLAPFYFLIRNPMAAAVVAQSCALVLLALVAYGAARVLRFSLPWQIATLFFFTFFPTFRIIFASLLNEALYIALSLAAFQFALRAVRAPSEKRWWRLACLAVLASATVRWNGLANGVFLLFPIGAQLKSSNYLKTSGRLLVAALVSAAPNPIWFFRNSFYLHKGTAMHDVTHLPHIAWEKVSVPFENMALRWGFGHFWIFLLLLAFALSPLVVARRRIRTLDYWMLAAGMFTQFLVIFLLTLAFSVTPLDDRYLSPSYSFFGLLLLFALETYSEPVGWWRRIGPALAAAGAIALCLYEILVANRASGLKLRPHLPPEYFLWQELRQRPYVAAASHYFSDDDFLHQIFLEEPHRLLFSNHVREPDITQRLRASGGSYFFVLHSGSEVQLFVNQAFPEMKQERIGEFLVYFR